MRTLVLFAFGISQAWAQPVLHPPVPDASAAARAPAPSLTELTRQAWELRQRSLMASVRHAELEAKALASQAWFPNAPRLGFDLRRDLPPGVALPGTSRVSESGRNEIEPGVSAPLWLPGQRDAQQRLVSQERALLEASQRLERLQIAGQVREAAWKFRMTQTHMQFAQARWESAQQLHADVLRKVHAGVLAPADSALSQAEALGAESGWLDARAQQGMATVELKRLTGQSVIGDLAEKTAPAQDAGNHPALEVATQAWVADQARLELAQRSRRDNPTLSAAARFDRDVSGAPYRNTFRMGMTWPLDTEARNAPRIAAAAAALTESEVAMAQRKRDLMAEIERSRMALALAQEAAQLSAQRHASMAQVQQAIERAFQAGERGLAELLRVRHLAFEAELAWHAARDQLGLAQARLNQALGLEP